MYLSVLSSVLGNKYLLAVVGASAIGFYVYAKFQTYEASIAKFESEKQIIEYQLASEKQKASERNTVIEDLKSEIEKEREAKLSLSRALQNSEAYGTTLIRKLQRHDLTRLTTEKPGLIENRINSATEEVFNEIINITRSGAES